jgi:uncharacterized protein YbaP (TraB family)
MLRRDFNLALCFLTMAPHSWSLNSVSRGPLFWLATRGKARVFLMGFGDGKAGDESWFTPGIRSAFRDSSELWLETAPSEALASRDPDTKAKAMAQFQELSHESGGRTFFDELEPEVRERTLAYMAELGVKKESVETLRPWWAYYTLNGAFRSRKKPTYEPVDLDRMLWGLATDQGKLVRYEMPDGVAFARFMAGMPEKAQSQYIEWLLDFIEDSKRGTDTDLFDWEVGNPVSGTRSLDRMRSKMPDLYYAIQVERNTWWAHKIDELLAADGTYFVAIGQLHVLGPDGIPSQLKRLRVVGPSGLRENPSVDATG